MLHARRASTASADPVCGRSLLPRRALRLCAASLSLLRMGADIHVQMCRRQRECGNGGTGRRANRRTSERTGGRATVRTSRPANVLANWLAADRTREGGRRTLEQANEHNARRNYAKCGGGADERANGRTSERTSAQTCDLATSRTRDRICARPIEHAKGARERSGKRAHKTCAATVHAGSRASAHVCVRTLEEATEHETHGTCAS